MKFPLPHQKIFFKHFVIFLLILLADQKISNFAVDMYCQKMDMISTSAEIIICTISFTYTPGDRLKKKYFGHFLKILP